MAQSAGAAASKEDKYVACLIGQSAVAMLKQGQRLNAETAREQAYKVCRFVGKLNPEVLEGIGDYVNMIGSEDGRRMPTMSVILMYRVAAEPARPFVSRGEQRKLLARLPDRGKSGGPGVRLRE